MISDGEDGTDSKKYSTVRTYRPLNLCVLVGYFYLLKQGLLLNLEFADLTAMAGQLAPVIFLSLVHMQQLCQVLM